MGENKKESEDGGDEGSAAPLLPSISTYPHHPHSLDRRTYKLYPGTAKSQMRKCQGFRLSLLRTRLLERERDTQVILGGVEAILRVDTLQDLRIQRDRAEIVPAYGPSRICWNLWPLPLATTPRDTSLSNCWVMLPPAPTVHLPNDLPAVKSR
jgi:hypothetical protein